MFNNLLSLIKFDRDLRIARRHFHIQRLIITLDTECDAGSFLLQYGSGIRIYIIIISGQALPDQILCFKRIGSSLRQFLHSSDCT